MNRKTTFSIIALTAAVVMGTVSCEKVGEKGGSDTDNISYAALKTDPKIAVISDPHFFDLSLLEGSNREGSEFDKYVKGDRKLIKESSAILESVITTLIAEKPDVVLVCGDMTKDGEKISHQNVIKQLDRLRAKGIRVLVTPGNHDMSSPAAYSFNGTKTTIVPNVSPTEFAQMYKNYGFDSSIALEQGPDLSYVAEVGNNVWVVSMDSCEYLENPAQGEGSPITKGSMSAEKLQWALDKTAEGVAKGKKVFGMMHHGVVEHYDGQTVIFGEYVVEDWDNISDRLARAGMSIVFTGHYHAQDIRRKMVDGTKFIFDVQTGSTVTAPCPYRILTLSGNTLDIRSQRVQTIKGFPGVAYYGQLALDNPSFPDYATAYLASGMQSLITGILSDYVDASTANTLAPLVEPILKETMVAHYAGDEGEMSAENVEKLNGLMNLLGNMTFEGDVATMIAAIPTIVNNMWDDAAPADNNVSINLSTGEAN